MLVLTYLSSLSLLFSKNLSQEAYQEAMLLYTYTHAYRTVMLWHLIWCGWCTRVPISSWKKSSQMRWVHSLSLSTLSMYRSIIGIIMLTDAFESWLWSLRQQLSNCCLSACVCVYCFSAATPFKLCWIQHIFNLFIVLFIYLSIYLSIYLFIYLSVQPCVFVYVCMYLSIYLVIGLSSLNIIFSYLF